MRYLISSFQFPVSAPCFQLDNTSHFGKKCKLVNEGRLKLSLIFADNKDQA